jgi:hypothetical protein
VRSGRVVLPEQQADETDGGSPEGGADPEDQDRIEQQERELQRGDAALLKDAAEQAHGAEGGQQHQGKEDDPTIDGVGTPLRGDALHVIVRD